MMYISLSLSPNVPSKLYRSIEEQDGGRERTKERKKLAAFVCRRNKRVRLHNYSPDLPRQTPKRP